jgi:uncharacterized protein YacL
MGPYFLRLVVVSLIAAGGYFHPPFGLGRWPGAGAGAFLGAAFVLLEARLHRAQFKVIWSAFVGTLAGILLGWMVGGIYQGLFRGSPTSAFVRIVFLVVLPYVGFTVGTRRPEWLDPLHLLGLFREKPVTRSFKILDTSVIIDGRIADICDTHFIEGTLVVPQFILKELQVIADSADGMKRQRGRRGLDVLDHLQKSTRVSVIISETDFPDIPDVDSKLIECAKGIDAGIITNDFNLNKVAQLQGITVLNINELANALKPVVLPGEGMRVFILKEGKEKDQGVAYLDDGTMVVVDNARRMIGQTIDITVTSVLQTTVGKMIFGRFNHEEPR